MNEKALERLVHAVRSGNQSAKVEEDDTEYTYIVTFVPTSCY